MILTSAAINKRLKELNEEKELILERERESYTYEKVEGYEEVIPEYNFAETQKALGEIDEKVRQLKHALNCMNSTEKLEHFDFTVDEALVYMAQLNKRKEILDEMRKKLPVARKRANRYGETSNLVEYTCANYDVAEADSEYKRIFTEINQLQMDIDYINQTIAISVEID